MTAIRRLLMIAAAILLVEVNWLAFHDFREPHTIRDWLVLVATLFVVAEFAFQLARSGHRPAS